VILVITLPNELTFFLALSPPQQTMGRRLDAMREENKKKKAAENAKSLEDVRQCVVRGQSVSFFRGQHAPPAIRVPPLPGSTRCLIVLSRVPYADLPSQLKLKRVLPGAYQDPELGVYAFDAFKTECKGIGIDVERPLRVQFHVMPSGDVVKIKWTCCRSCESETTKKYKVCQTCRQAKYCSVECMRADFPSHKEICPKLSAFAAKEKTAVAGKKIIALVTDPYIHVYDPHKQNRDFQSVRASS
jgi:hypothetical protein